MINKARRFTTEYHSEEDRIRLSVELEDNSVQILWLTQRLTDRLLARLVSLLDKAPLPSRTDNDTMAAKVQQRFNQQAAAASLVPQKPVRIPASDHQTRPPTLITGLNMRSSEKAVHLEFKSKDTVLVEIALKKGELRQWLSVFFACYKKAEWAGTFWPDWIKPEASTVQSDKLAKRLIN